MRREFLISLVNAIIGGLGFTCVAQTLAAESLSMELVAERHLAVNGNNATGFELAHEVTLGEAVFFTLLVRNTSGSPVQSPVIDYPIPRNTRYIAGSAVGPGAEVSVSVDGGLSFDDLQRLRVPVTVGAMRAATGGDCTHIRWKMKHTLLPGSVAKLRFRAEFR
jgi:uncharacterized repeat protein (TIGR01451 family)